MFTRCYADNFRCFSGFELEFQPLTVLLGPNGAGKSSVIAVLAKLRDFILGRGTSLDLFPPETLTRWNNTTVQTFELGAALTDGHYDYRLRLAHSPGQALNKVVEESLKLNGQPLFVSDDKKMHLYDDSHVRGAELMPDWHISGISRIHERHDNKRLFAFKTLVENTIVLALNPALVRAVDEERRPVTLPKPDCSDFASWLRHLSAAEPLVRQEAERRLAEGLPGFRAFADEPAGDARVLRCVFAGVASRATYKLRLDELSSGQIAMVILETALAMADAERPAGQSAILVLDEPGNFLALSEIQPLLSRLQDAALEKRFQVALTAHHPIALDFLAGSYGIWLDRDAGRHTRRQPIHLTDSAHPSETDLRVSDLVARGWLSGLGVDEKNAETETASH